MATGGRARALVPVLVLSIGLAAGVLAGLSALIGTPATAQTPAPPVDPAATVVDPAATQPPSSEVLPSTTTIVPPNCTEIPPPFIVFVGHITAYQSPTFRFQLEEVRAGSWDGPLIDVEFPRDAGFLRVGPSYLVAAQVDTTTGKLYSKVRHTFQTQAGSGTCPGDDPIITRLADGGAVDTGLLSGMKGKWGRVITAFVIPAVVVIAVLVVLVILKHVLGKVLKTAPVSSRRRPYMDAD